MTTTISTSLLLPNATEASEFISSEHSLKVALSAEANTRQVRAIMVGSAAVRESTLRLARIISHAFPSETGDVPLLQLAVRNATAAYLEAAMELQRIELHERAYLLALHGTAVQMAGTRAYAVWDESGNTEAWRPFEMPLVDWVKKVAPDRVTFLPVDPADSQIERKATVTMLAAHLFRMERPYEICAAVESHNAG